MFNGMFLLAQVAAPAAATGDGDLPAWFQMLMGVLSLLITALLLPYLKRKAEAAKAEAEKLQAEAGTAAQNTRDILLKRLEAIALGAAARIAEKEFPKLALMVKNGELKDKAAVKGIMYKWGAALRDEIIAYFKIEGIDIIAAVGDDYLDHLIEKVANKVSPFPGRETAVHMLQANVSDWLIAHGVAYVKNRYDTSDTDGESHPVPAAKLLEAANGTVG
jgi:hypothetical protein